MELKVAISPCPNDTFIFGAIANKLIPTGIYNFNISYFDIDELNQLATGDEYDLIKMSYYHYLKYDPDYNALPCGGALGYNCGPLLISKSGNPADLDEDSLIAIPGENTTANFLLKFYNPKLTLARKYRFDKIEEAVNEEVADAGVIIHESRFTYQEKGLKQVADLGAYWEQKTHGPIPLGCVALAYKHSWHEQEQITEIIRASIEYAQAHYDELLPYIREHAQALDDKVIKAHIDLYVNDFTLHIQREGRLAIDRMEAEIKQQIAAG